MASKRRGSEGEEEHQPRVKVARFGEPLGGSSLQVATSRAAGGTSGLASNIQGEEAKAVSSVNKLIPATRISKRSVKKKKVKTPVDDIAEETEDYSNKKRRRTWELWRPNEKHIFFEALNEYGKDFDKIQYHFQAKLKKQKNLSPHSIKSHQIKNKNQIRHFYYRTWHRISAHLHFTSDLTKNSKELIGLINYGELWKKIGGTVDEKSGQKLDELVQKGTAAVKVKGKSQRIKTPVCRALKKVHNKGDTLTKAQIKSKLPNKVMIELRPRSTSDWCKVQRLAQNPHLKVNLGVGRRLCSLIRCLERKWRSQEVKMKEGLVRKEGEEEEEEVKDSGVGDLILMPVRGAVIKEEQEVVIAKVVERPKVKIKMAGLDGEVLVLGGGANGGVGGGRDEEEPSKFEEILSLQRSKPCEGENHVKETGEGSNHAGETVPTGIERFNSFDDNSNDDVALRSNDEDQVSRSPRLEAEGLETIEEEEGAEEFLLDLSDQECSRSPVPDMDEMEEIEYEEEEEGIKEDDLKEEDIKEDEDTNKDELVEECQLEGKKWGNPREGWDHSGAGSLTIGDIYCLLRGGEAEGKLRLDYCWRREEATEVKKQCENLLSRLTRLAQGSVKLPARGRTASQGSPSVRTVISPQTLARSPMARPGLNSPVGRPHLGGGASKQILLPAPPPAPVSNRPSSPLAVPLDPEPEFRKPLAPAARQGAMSAAFREQIGQYLPKFSNRRGRQSRNRAKQVVGRQLLQPLQPAPPPQVLQPLLVVQGMLPVTAPAPISPILPPSHLGTSPPDPPVPHTDPQSAPQSPPQLSIPSPRRSPSPTPSFSCLLDLSYPDSAPSTPTKSNQESLYLMYNGDGDTNSSLLQTPPRPAPTPSPSRCLQDSQDLSLSSWSLNFESPIKSLSHAPLGYSEDSQCSNSSEVDRQLNAMMCENSLDFTSKFARLAKHVSDQDNS